MLTRCNGTIVSGHLSTVSKRVGVPVQIVSDHGSDVLAGIRLFRQKNRHVVETYDITHGLAILLKNQLEPDPCWTSFVKACQSTRQQLQQELWQFPPTPGLWSERGSSIWRVTWGGPTICWPCSVVASKGPWRSSLVGAKPRPNNGLKRNWVGCEGTRAKWRVWSYFQRVVKDAEEEIKHEAGLSRTSWRRIKRRLIGESKLIGKERAFRRQVLAFVQKEGAKVPVRQRYLVSTDVLELLFGKYKDLAEHAPSREITANVLMIPLLVTPLTPELLRQALETVRGQDVEQWLEEHLALPPQKKKRVVLTAAGRRNAKEDPEPA